MQFTADQQALKDSVDDFFVHSLHDKTIHLQLPLPAHKKTVHDLFVVTKGYAKRQVGIHCYEIQPNELLIVPELQVSTTDFYSEDLEGFYCHFSEEFLADSSLLLNWQLKKGAKNKIKLSPSKAKRIEALFEMLNELYREDWCVNKKLISQYLRTILSEINMQQSQDKQGIVDKKRDLTLEYIGLIHANINKSYSISELAHMLHITPNHLNKTVKMHLGKSAQSIYNEILLQEAKVLLLQTSKDISEIAFDLGFNDSSYFGKFFKKLTFQTPLEYRKMIEKYQ